MAKLIAIVGESGTGKSSSLEKLDPKESYIINIAAKPLPFKGSSKSYNSENKNYKEIDDPKEVIRLLELISSETKIKDVVIDDSNYLMGFSMVRKATETGYTKFSVMAQEMVNLLTKAAKLRSDLNIYYLTHPDIVTDGDEIIGYKIKTSGKLIDSQINMDGLFSISLYTDVEEDKSGNQIYSFVTNRYKKYPAKSPKGMFKDTKIPNDLTIVSKAIEEYYK